MTKIINITKKAFPILQKIYLENKKKYIAFSINSGGCSGFQYNIEACNIEPNKLDEVINVKNINIKIDKDSLLYLLGTEIDWEDNIMGQRFIFNNPN